MLGGTTGAARTSAGTYYQAIIAGSSNTIASFADSATFTGVVSGLSVRESANGLYCSEYTPNNSVSSGVITAGTGDLLHPWHWERIGYSVPVKRLDVYDPWVADTATVEGTRKIPTTRNGYYYTATTVAGDTKTDPSTEPTWPTTIGGTVVDDQVTWTCSGYYTNEGVAIEPATTQDMATAAVLATGGSASTYPTSWSEVDSGSIGAVIGEGVSQIHPDARYIDIRINNTTGGNQTYTVILSTTQLTGVSQGDIVTLSAWLQVTSGSVGGSPLFGIQEYNSTPTFQQNTTTAIAVPSTMARVGKSLTVGAASTDRYRPFLQFSTVPNGSDFTIRITLPNSVQQSFVSSVILGQETRTSQVGALKYSDANWNEASIQARCDFSLGVAQASVSAAQSVFTVASSNAFRGLYIDSSGGLGSSDGSTAVLVSDWGEPANSTIRSALTASGSDRDVYAYSPNVDTSTDGAYDGAFGADGNLIIAGTTLVYPMRIHNLVSVPNGYETSVTLESDSERYT